VRFTTEELAAGLVADLAGPPGQVDGVGIDSRALEPGQLFVALRAERDGHEFVPAAVAGGAAAVLVDHPLDGVAVPQLVVADTAAAMERLADLARDRLPDRVVGITGSVGKTTTKDLLATVLRLQGPAAASERSFNNELGVPVTLANAPDDALAAVVEMGARGRGHIEYLCRMARPTVGIVTAVEAVHTEVMGGVEDIAVAKRELVEALPPQGAAVLNADNPYVAAMASATSAQVVMFGAAGEVRAQDVEVDGELRASFRLESPWGSAPVSLGVRGVHNVGNALAAAAAALVLEVPLELVVAGLAVPPASPWRMDLQRTASGAVVLNDAYNAGPASMEAALRSVALLPVARHHAVLGPMAELGDHSLEAHRHVALVAEQLGVRLIAVGTDAYGIEPVPDLDAAIGVLGALDDDDAVLVKGSRVAGLERLAHRLLGH